MRDIHVTWWRTRIDNLPTINISVPLRGNRRFRITNTIMDNRLTSVLNITDITLIHVGPYWLRLNDNEDISNMAFLNVSHGMYVHTYARMCEAMHICMCHIKKILCIIHTFIRTYVFNKVL